MNILIVSLAYAPYSGVGAARMTSLSQYLIDKGNRVTVICYDSKVFGEAEQKRKIPQGVERVCIEMLPQKRDNIKNIQMTMEQVINQKKFDICISSVGPYETMFFIDKVCKQRGLPYIIDYRDPWLFEKTTIKPKGLLKYKLLLHDILYRPVEKRVIKNAAKIVSVTDRCQEDLIKRYHVDSKKCKVIYNGYEDAPTVHMPGNEEAFVIGIAGKFASYNAEAAEAFLMVCKNILPTNSVKVMHIGKKEEFLEDKYAEVYANVGEKNHKDTMEELTKANVLLVSYAHTSGLGTKVFDYIALNKPIIYIGVVPSELSEFIGQFENSYICANYLQMQEAIENLIHEKPINLTTLDIKKYSREEQNRMYGNLINEIIQIV